MTRNRNDTNTGTGTGTAAPQRGLDVSGKKDHQSAATPCRGWYSRGYLPHFDSPQVLQHITYRLADSLPRSVLDQMQVKLRQTIRDETKRKTELRRRIEAYLDAGYGSCVLREPRIAACVVDTWLRFDGERYRLLEWVVMPNHCHVLIEPFAGVPLGKIVLSWKSYTGRRINEYKGRAGARRSQARRSQVWRSQARRSQVWQREYWDRFIRNQRHFEAVKRYIVMNPVAAGLVTRPEDWPWSSASVRSRRDGLIGK